MKDNGKEWGNERGGYYPGLITGSVGKLVNVSVNVRPVLSSLVSITRTSITSTNRSHIITCLIQLK